MDFVLLCYVFVCKLAHIGLQPVKWCTKVLSYSNRNDDKYPPSRWKQLIVVSLNNKNPVRRQSDVHFYSCQIFHFALGNHRASQTLYFLVFIDDICNVVLSRADAFGLCLLDCRRRPFFFLQSIAYRITVKTREREIYELLITLLVFAKCLSRNKFPFLFWLLFAIEF